MTKKVKGTTQLDNLIIKEKKFYWNLNQSKEYAHSVDKIKRELDNSVKGITQIEKEKLDFYIEMEEVSKCLMKTRNNVAPGYGGFTGAFYKIFWCYLKHVVLGAIY